MSIGVRVFSACGVAQTVVAVGWYDVLRQPAVPGPGAPPLSAYRMLADREAEELAGGGGAGWQASPEFMLTPFRAGLAKTRAGPY